MDCKHHDRYERLRTHVHGKIPVDLILPCCHSPVERSFFFQERRFYSNNHFDAGVFEAGLASICNPSMCPSFEAGRIPIYEIVAGTWRKCPLRCVTCFNHYEDNRNEPVLSDSEMEAYLIALGELGAAAIERNSKLNAPPPYYQVGGSGDIFYSENYRRMLEFDLPAYGIAPIHILTNMQFWTNYNIRRISAGTRSAVKLITFSVDSIQPELYERIRSGSRWTNLVRSYERCHAVFPDTDYHISYTISKLNFHEYKQAPRALKELFPAVSTIYLNVARDWLNRPETADLVISSREKAEIFEWCASNPDENGCKIYAR